MLFKPSLKQTGEAATTGAVKVAGQARRRIVSLILAIIVIGGLGYILWTAFKPATRARTRTDLPVPVLAATPVIKDVPVYLDGVGTIKAMNTVTVRAQVDGKLLKVLFKEGQDVERGDVLAEIDPVLYKAQLDQAVAKKAQDEATLANARLDLVRYQQLAQTNAGSKQQADTQKALVAQYEAQVRSDQAAIDTAQATLGYTKVTAPLAGRTGLRQVDEGNIVHASDTTGLVVITQIKPIAVWFSLPQQQLARVNAAFAKGPLAVDVFGNDGRTVVDSGKLNSIDNQVDPTTGTVKLKAEFPNASLQLWPGQYANVRMKVETLSQATVVPTSAVQRGPAGTYAYVIGDDNVVSAKAVTVTQQNDVEAVIASGLTPDDRIVTTGFANLSEGAKVFIGKNDNTPTPDLAPRRKGGKKGGGGRAQGSEGQRGHDQNAQDKGAKASGGQGGSQPATPAPASNGGTPPQQ
jgi:multidrug efflux system membrane fusion protein